MENCISDLCDWMTSSKLKMNDDKTECMLIGTRQQLTKLSINHISVGDTTVATSRTVRNLGTLLDSNMSFHEQINKLSKSSFYFLYNIRKIRKISNKRYNSYSCSCLRYMPLGLLQQCTVWLTSISNCKDTESPKCRCKVGLQGPEIYTYYSLFKRTSLATG